VAEDPSYIRPTEVPLLLAILQRLRDGYRVSSIFSQGDCLEDKSFLGLSGSLEKCLQGVEREEGVGREQIADDAERQIRKMLTSAEQSRDSIGHTGATDDHL